MPDILIYTLTAIGAYLVGSIPFGFLAAKAKGIDIRSAGSGNIGATNAMRVLGKPAGILVLVLDALKGYCACALGAWVCAYFSSRYFNGFAPNSLSGDQSFERVFDLSRQNTVLAGIFAVLGHNYTCWLKFKGGKGIATTAGVYLALAPWALLIALVGFLLAVAVTRYVSVGSLCAAIALPAAVWLMRPNDLFFGVVTTLLGILAIFKHKSNIQRLIAGTENRLGQKTEADT